MQLLVLMTKLLLITTKNKKTILRLSFQKDFKVPYGVCEFDKNFMLKKLRKNPYINFILILESIF